MTCRKKSNASHTAAATTAAVPALIPAQTEEVAPPPYSEERHSSAILLSNVATPASTVTADGPHYDPRLPPAMNMQRKQCSYMQPVILPSPFTKAPKSKVTNFRSGVNEGAKSAWAEVVEGLKAPAVETWIGLRDGGLFGGVGGLIHGSVGMTIAPIAATIVFVNHSSRGIIRGMRAANANVSTDPFHDSAELGVGSGEPKPQNEQSHVTPAVQPSRSDGPGRRARSAMVHSSDFPADEKIAGAVVGEEQEASPVEMATKWDERR